MRGTLGAPSRAAWVAALTFLAACGKSTDDSPLQDLVGYQGKYCSVSLRADAAGDGLAGVTSASGRRVSGTIQKVSPHGVLLRTEHTVSVEGARRTSQYELWIPAGAILAVEVGLN